LTHFVTLIFTVTIRNGYRSEQLFSVVSGACPRLRSIHCAPVLM